MATDKQIAANRANARHSTGPRTGTGKQRSKRNAFKHGLSGPVCDDLATLATAAAILESVLGSEAVDMVLRGKEPVREAAFALAKSQTQLQRVSIVRNRLLARMEYANSHGEELQMLRTLDRYERLARTESRRASRTFQEWEWR